MSKAIEKACGYSCYFVADKDFYLNSKLAAFVIRDHSRSWWRYDATTGGGKM
jgi:hypothetical protein